MIKECNFKTTTSTDFCDLREGICDGEDKCILFQIYKLLQFNRKCIDNFAKGFSEGAKADRNIQKSIGRVWKKK